MSLYKHAISWSFAYFSAVHKPQTGKLNFTIYFSLYFLFSYPFPSSTARKKLKILLFKLTCSFDLRKWCHAENDRITRLRFPAITNDRRAGVRLKGAKLQILRSQCVKTLWLLLVTLKQTKTDMAKTNDRVSTIDSPFEKHSGNFPPLYPVDD